MKIFLFFVLTLITFPEEIYTTKAGGGWFIKDALTVQVFDDPYITGVSCYTTYYDRAWSFTDSHKSSLACRQTGDVVFSTKRELQPRKGVFTQSKSIFFKYTVVDRVWDAKRGVLVYLTYSKTTDEDTATHSISVVSIGKNFKIKGK